MNKMFALALAFFLAASPTIAFAQGGGGGRAVGVACWGGSPLSRQLCATPLAPSPSHHSDHMVNNRYRLRGLQLSADQRYRVLLQTTANQRL